MKTGRTLPRKLAACTVIALASVLLVINVAGYLVPPKVQGPDAMRRGVGVPGYNFRTRTSEALQGLLETPMDKFNLVEVNNVIFESLVHSDQRQIQLQENWLLWFGGMFYEHLSRTQDPTRIVAGGAALCGEAAAVLNAVADVNGFEARLIALSGHMISEVKTSDGWRAADPDYGIVYPVGVEELQGARGAELMRTALTARGFSAETIKNYILIVQSPEDNAVLDVGAPSSPRLRRAEIAADWLKWVIPLLLLLAGWLWYRQAGTRRADAEAH